MAEQDKTTLDGAFLRERRDSLGISLGGIMGSTGYSKSNISGLETGHRRSISIDAVQSLAPAYQLDPAEFVLRLLRIEQTDPEVLSQEAIRIGRAVMALDPEIREGVLRFIDFLRKNKDPSPEPSSLRISEHLTEKLDAIRRDHGLPGVLDFELEISEADQKLIDEKVEYAWRITRLANQIDWLEDFGRYPGEAEFHSSAYSHNVVGWVPVGTHEGAIIEASIHDDGYSGGRHTTVVSLRLNDSQTGEYAWDNIHHSIEFVGQAVDPEDVDKRLSAKILINSKGRFSETEYRETEFEVRPGGEDWDNVLLVLDKLLDAIEEKQKELEGISTKK